MSSTCAGCHQNLPKREYLTCAFCKNSYDLECANVSETRFYGTMSLEHKQSWKCQACYCKVPKTGNMDTPLRLCDRENILIQEQITPTQNSNITIRKRTQICNDTISSEDLSVLGDTIINENILRTTKTEISDESLQILSTMISEKLQENNKSLLSQFEATIQSEINKAITKLKVEMKNETTTLNEENEKRKSDLQLVNTKIEHLNKENERLQYDINKLEKKISTTKISPAIEYNNKKFVLYGVPETYKEPEQELHNRIVEIFRDIYEVNLSGYIEEIHRVGRYKNTNRPIVIELISKRMCKYLLDNKNYFYGTRLAISEFLDGNAQTERKVLRGKMLEARKNGLHAVIRNNQLYIEGKRIIIEYSDQPKIFEKDEHNTNDTSTKTNERGTENESNSFRN